MLKKDSGFQQNLSKFRFLAEKTVPAGHLSLGVFDIIGKAGIAIPALTMICGTAVAVMPYEFLPGFWQKYIYSWEPLRMLTDGIREIIYRGSSWWNDCSQPLVFMAAAGIALMLLSLLKSRRKNHGVQQQTQEDPCPDF